MSSTGGKSDYSRAVHEFNNWYPQSAVANDALRDFVSLDHEILEDYRQGNNVNDVTLAEFIRSYRREFVRLVNHMSEFVLPPSDAAQEIDNLRTSVHERYESRYGFNGKVDALERWQQEYGDDEDPEWWDDDGDEMVMAERVALTFQRLVRSPQYVIYVLLVVFIIIFVRPYMVPSGSMIPTLMEGDRILTLARYFPDGKTYKPGDIVCFWSPDDKVYVKRVVATGGDTVKISGEKLYVNGEESPYQGGGTGMVQNTWELADDQYFMMGDNRSNSQDSRYIGPVSANKVIGKVDCIYWPFDHATMFGGSGLLGL